MNFFGGCLLTTYKVGLNETVIFKKMRWMPYYKSGCVVFYTFMQKTLYFLDHAQFEQSHWIC